MHGRAGQHRHCLRQHCVKPSTTLALLLVPTGVSVAEKWIRMPLAEVVSAEKAGPLHVYKDRWWVVDTDRNVIFYKTTHSPQCNSNKAIVERLMLREEYGPVEMVFVPWAYVRFNIGDYA